MSSGFDLDDRAFLQGLRNAVSDFNGIGEANQRDRAGRILERAKERVRVRTGETRDSLQVSDGTDENGRKFYDVGSRLDKAVYEEFGTIHNTPNPFMRSSIAEELR